MFLFFCSETRLFDGGVGQFLESAVDSLLQYLGVRCLDSHGACEVVDLADASRVHIRFRDIDSVLDRFWCAAASQQRLPGLAERLAIFPVLVHRQPMTMSQYVDALQCDIALRRVSVQITYLHAHFEASVQITYICTLAPK